MKYVILTPAIGSVGGAQIYCRNKLKYCQQKGFDTYLFYNKKRKIDIEDLKQYAKDGLVKELAYYPQYYTKKCREKVISKILKKIDFCDEDEIIFESHSPSESVWGELLAQRCNGRNMVFLLPEIFDNLSIQVLAFLKFKYERKELACITDGVMQRLFQNYMPMQIEACYSLKAVCTNSVEDIEIPAEYCTINQNKVIGIIGRLQKQYVRISAKGIVSLAKSHPDERFQVIIIGGSDNQKDYEDLSGILKKNENIEWYITGNIYPIPQKLIKQMNVCLAAAGCVTVARRELVPTISVDSYIGKAIGVVGYNTISTILSTEQDDVRPVEEYLEEVLYGDFLTLHQYTPLPYQLNIDSINVIFDKHMEFIKGFDKNKNYYGLLPVPIRIKDLIKKVILSTSGIRGFDIVVNMISKIS